MKARKTDLYIIATYLNDGILASKIEVSKIKFDKAVKDALKQYNNQESDSEFYVKLDTRCYDRGNYIESITEYTAGISYLCFIHVACKDGYVFGKEKEK